MTDYFGLPSSYWFELVMYIQLYIMHDLLIIKIKLSNWNVNNNDDNDWCNQIIIYWSDNACFGVYLYIKIKAIYGDGLTRRQRKMFVY